MLNSSPFVRLGLIAGATFALMAGAAQAQSPRLSIEAVSTRPDLVSGGDVLVRVRAPKSSEIYVNGRLAVERLTPAPDGDGFLALVTGLDNGANVLTVGQGRGSASLTVTNHPSGGPMFSGPQIQPWTCLPGAMNRQCDRATRVRYAYLPTGATAFKEYDPAKPAADVSSVTTSEGVRMPFVVRVESITQNRSGVQVATLFDPAKPWTPFQPQAQWNKGVYVLQGSGCGTGFSEVAAADPLNARALSKGFVVVTAALLHNTNNCNPIVQAEAAIMAKEHVAETYGLFDLVFGQGSSGGAISQITNQNAYPGLYDGLILNHAFADSDASRMAAYDCRLIYDAMAQTGSWTDAQKSAVAGMISGCNSAPERFQIYDPAIGTGCNVPDAQKFNAATNPTGVRCTLQDYQANVVGRRNDGYAYGRLDNEGVQYGLKALNAGSITPQQFVDLNAAIGGHDINFVPTKTRTRADRAGLRRLYQTGVANTVNNLAETPVIETRLNVTDFHQPFHAVMVRARLDRAQGHHDNYALWKTTTAREAALNDAAFDTMVTWIKAIKADTRKVPRAQKVIDARPPLARDRCVADGVDQPLTACPRPPEVARVLAGAPDTNDVGKCRLKPLKEKHYAPVAFTEAQWASLKATFKTGVCDYSKPMVDFALTVPWLSYGSAKPEPLGRRR